VSLRRTKQNWNDLADFDTHWAILGYPDLRSGKWDEQEFFRTGEREIEEVMTTAKALGHPHRRDRALDFGCGIGRLTRPLAQRFSEVYGVDISDAMIAQARALNTDLDNCRFLHHYRADLRVFEDASFDLVYTVLVLQHLSSRRLARAVLREFVRILKPGGLIVFHIPTHLPFARLLQPRRRLYALLTFLGFDRMVLMGRFRLAPIQLIALSESSIGRLMHSVGARILRVTPGNYYLAKGAESRNYWITK
jgi:ubiquinone/menaquinone biosynthesis C-methylase UbiE